jgi:hypothetical protein
MTETENSENKTEPVVVTEITIRALNDGNVSMTCPQGSNVWVLRGILAKALEMALQIPIETKG